MHDPLLRIKILIIMRKLMGRPVLADVIKQACYVPQCLVDLEIHHICVFLAVGVSLMTETIFVIRAAAEWPISVDGWRPQVIVSLPVFLTILVSVAFCRNPSQHKQVVIVYWFFEAINFFCLLLFFCGSLFDYLLDIFSFYLLNLLYLDCLDQDRLWLLHIFLFYSFVHLFFFIRHKILAFQNDLLRFFEILGLDCFFGTIDCFFWLLWDRHWLLINLLLIIFIVFILVIVFVNILIIILVVFVVLSCIFIILSRILFFPILAVPFFPLAIATFMVPAAHQHRQSYEGQRYSKQTLIDHGLVLFIFI